MELDTLTLRSDIGMATPYDIAEEAQAASALVGDSSRALQRIAEEYVALASEPNGAVPLSRDHTRSVRMEIRHFLLRAQYLRATESIGLFELRRELLSVLEARGERKVDQDLLSDIEELIDSHANFDAGAGSHMDPSAVANIRDKLAILLTDVGLTLSLQEKLQLQQ